MKASCESDDTRRWLGIDFSGNHLKWRPACGTSNVWVADVRAQEAGFVLHDLVRVQQLPGLGAAPPFTRLSSLLGAGRFVAAAIDAPFSVPACRVPKDGHAALLALVSRVPCGGRPFPRGADFVRAVAGRAPPLSPPKPLRKTEEHWQEQGVNVRSTLWAGARGGAPMTAACLKLLAQAGAPLWPWSRAATGLVAEAFPAAQLERWNLAHVGYNGNDRTARVARRAIVNGIASRIALGALRATAAGDADALDAVLAAFAAIAVSRGRLAVDVDPAAAATEGWIAVHS